MRHLTVAVATATASLAFCAAARADSYVLLYKQSAVPASARADIQKAGGSLVYAYDQIGVAIARSDSGAFAGSLAKDARVDGVASTAGFASRVSEPAASGDGGGDLPNAPASDTDSLSPCSGTCARSTRRRPMRSPAAVARYSSVTSTPGSTTATRTCARTSTTPTASTA